MSSIGIPDILKQIPSIKKVIVFSYNKSDSTKHDYDKFDEILKRSDENSNFERFEFNHPIYILYSSGTTGFQSVSYMALAMP